MKRLLLPLLAILALLVMGISAIFLFSGALGPPDFNGTLYPEPRPTPEFALTNAAGEQVQLSDFRGQIVLLYFGYTFCPDACPATMADLARVQARVDESGEALQVLMVTVDPQRDTPQVVHDYVQSFHPTFVGLSGSEAQIARAAEDFGIFYTEQEGSDAVEYLVDHTTRVYLVNENGELTLTYAFGTPAEEIAADVRLLMP